MAHTPGNSVERIKVEEFHARMRAQGVSSRDHIAFCCVMCATPQSMASLIAAGVPADKAENYIGFSCVGRWTKAGPHKPGTQPGKGCDWTLGGLFGIRDLEIETEDGDVRPSFALATPEQAQALEADNARAALKSARPAPEGDAK